MKTHTKTLVLTALFAALCCVATMSVRIPTPGTGGYIHPGDAIVILSGVVLGPLYGFLAAGIGSCMSDLLGGYLTYVPITLLIKGLVAMTSAFAYQKLSHAGKHSYAGVAAGGILDMILVPGGYFCFEYFLQARPPAFPQTSFRAPADLSWLWYSTPSSLQSRTSDAFWQPGKLKNPHHYGRSFII